MPGESHSFSVQELIELLPERCRVCSYGQMLVAFERADLQTREPLQTIKEIGDRCIGYQGPAPGTKTRKWFRKRVQEFDPSDCAYRMEL